MFLCPGNMKELFLMFCQGVKKGTEINWQIFVLDIKFKLTLALAAAWLIRRQLEWGRVGGIRC